MKKIFAVTLILGFIFSSCQKDDVTATDYITETTLHADDQSRFSEETDAVANDANLVLEASAGFTGRTENIQTICDATVVIDTTSNPRTITITYNGTNCLGTRTRTGVIIISMPSASRWRNPGATLTVTYQNLKITRVRDNKSITLNGTQLYTNVTGGLLFNLAALGTITHTITSNNMSVTFDNGAQRTWHVARRRIFSFNSGIVISTSGTHSEGGVTGIAEWGSNRFGNNFTTVIAQPLIIKQDCSFRLVSGKVNHHTALYNAVVTFGLDATGNPTSCPVTGSYYLKIVWTGPSGIVRTVLLPY